MSSAINWTEVGVLVGVVGALAKWLASKSDRIGEHLERQDRAMSTVRRRLMAIEWRLGMRHPPEDDRDG